MSHKIWVVFLLFIHLLLLVFSIQHKTLTYDEPYHYQYGYNVFHFNTSRLNNETMPFFSDSKMPISCLNVIPGQRRNLFTPLPANRAAYIAHIRKNVLLGRYVTMLFSFVLGWYIYRWSDRLYGKFAADASLFLYAFSPNIIAHARLVTTDMYAICSITVAFYYFWNFMNTLDRKNAFFSAIALGIAQLTKYTALFLYPLFLILWLLNASTREFGFIKAKNYHALFEDWWKAGKTLFLFLIINLLIINTGFLWNGSFRLFRDYHFNSERFQALQQELTIIRNLPVPLPAPFVQGIDWIFYHDKTGVSFGNIYLLGKIQRTNTPEFVGFKGYYWIASLFKFPLATQIIIMISLISYLVKRKKYAFRRNELYLLLPVCAYSLYFNLLHRTQIGIRHYLVILPFLYVFVGSFLKDWRTFTGKTRTLLSLLAVYLVLSVLSYYPHYLSYFNELVWDRKKAYKILADSNIDWDQNKEYLARYLKKHPEVIVNPPGPTTGKILVRVNDLVGVSTGPEQYRWLREHYEPTAHVAYSYLIFDLSQAPSPASRGDKGSPSQ